MTSSFCPNTGIVVQARMGSARLPGKTLLPLAGKTVLEHLIERLKTVPQTRLIIATSVKPEDDAIVNLCYSTQTHFMRGHPENVLSRYVKAAELFSLDVIVRITGDCPLMDPQMVMAMLHAFKQSDFDYYCNIRPRTFPRGLDCEIFPRKLLETAFRESKPTDIPEYVVVPYVNRNLPKLRIGNYTQTNDHSNLRWTLDEQSDYQLIAVIYEKLYPIKKLFLEQDILELLEKEPVLKTVNAHVRQKSI